mmetsp:Transcript_19244/g.22281  ORF Transcript_19244/g.22281 Transcript_19244/m.22281 type:complete len:560 (+) Transcript_19244:51-1730(+)
MSYEGGRGYDQDSRGRRSRGRGFRRAAWGGRYRGNRDNREEQSKDQSSRQSFPKNQGVAPGRKEVGAKPEVKTDQKRMYSKSQMLEMFYSIDIATAKKYIHEEVEVDILVDLSQSPVLLDELENELTLENLRPRKGPGGPRKRGEYQNDKQGDDMEDEDDPEWLDFEPQDKKFDFSKQVPFTKMFEGENVKYEALEDDEDEKESTQEPEPISIEQLERQTFNKLEQEKQKEVQFTQKDPQFSSKEPHFMQKDPQFIPKEPMNTQMPYDQNVPNYGFPQQFSMGSQFNMYQQPMNQFENPMGFSGFPGQDPFGGFGQPLDNPMGMGSPFDDGMGFGNNIFGSPFGRDTEYDKIFGQAPSNPEGMFGFGSNALLTQNDDDDEEDDWMMDDQFENTEKHLGFIDQHGESPVKPQKYFAEETQAKQRKTDEVMDRTFKFVKTERKRVPKPRRVHTFEPKFKQKKRFEKLFDKDNSEEAQNKKLNHQDLSMYLVKKYWDMREDPTTLDMLNLIQNPFSHHILNKRNSPPQFYVNKDGPVQIAELFMWFNQGLVPKFFLIGHDEN